MNNRSLPKNLVAVSFLIATIAQRAAAEQPVPEIPRPQIPQKTFSVTEYGAVGDGVTVNTAAIAKAIAACNKAGGGIVVVPVGRFLTGPFALANNIELHLEKDATLLFTDDLATFPKDAKGGFSNELTASGCHDIAITGAGSIDGQGQKWWKEFLKTKGAPADVPHMAHRPFMIVLRDCTRVLVQGVTLTNSPSFHLVPQACQDVVIDHVRILAPVTAPNTDGIDPSGQHFLITHCTFDVGDDCIAIKPTGESPANHLSCENFLITDCMFLHGHGMSIGGQTPGGLRHLVVQNSTFENTDAGIRMKANRGVGGLVEDCTYDHLTMKNVKTAIFITSYYPERDTPKSPGDDPALPVIATTPIWRNIRINNVTAIGSQVAGRIIGLPEMPISNIEFSNVNISAEKPMVIWNSKDIHFTSSQINIAKGARAIEFDHSSGIAGIDEMTGTPK